jgi:hypothetical protein
MRLRRRVKSKHIEVTTVKIFKGYKAASFEILTGKLISESILLKGVMFACNIHNNINKHACDALNNAYFSDYLANCTIKNHKYTLWLY